MHLKTAEFGRQSREEMKEGRMQKGGALKTVRSEAEPRNERRLGTQEEVRSLACCLLLQFMQQSSRAAHNVVARVDV